MKTGWATMKCEHANKNTSMGIQLNQNSRDSKEISFGNNGKARNKKQWNFFFNMGGGGFQVRVINLNF